MIKDRFFIKRISYKEAMSMVIKHHYLHRKAPCSFAFGLYDSLNNNGQLFDGPKLCGVIVYGTPSSAPLRMGICGVEEKDNVIELTRLWVDDSAPKNCESYLIGNTLKKVDKEIIVSFSDTSAGHIGTVYQATNFIYTGLSAKRTNWTIEGVYLHCQTIADKYTSAELKKLLGDKFTNTERPRKHRYVFFNCNKKRKKALLNKLKYPIQQYPKL